MGLNPARTVYSEATNVTDLQPPFAMRMVYRLCSARFSLRYLPGSRLAIVSLQPNAGQMDVSWQSVWGKFYRVLTSTNLIAGGWISVAEGIAATGTNTTTSVGATASSHFIRIELDE